MVSVLVKHPPAHSVAHPWTKSSVLGVQLHGITSDERTWHVGIGQRIGGQSAGLVVRVMTGHGVLLDGRTGGRVTTLVTTRVCVVVLVGRGVGVGVGCRLLVVQASLLVRNSIAHPWYGQAASHGATRVAVGTDTGQLHGFRIVCVRLQSVRGHSLRHDLLCTVRVAVGQLCAATRPTRARSTEVMNSFMVRCCLCLGEKI